MECRVLAIHGIHLLAGQLAALAGLSALSHLDLQIAGVGQVVRGHTEAAGSHLLDGAAPLRVVEPILVLTALTGVGPAADPVHSDRQRLVRLLADRPVRHRTGGEALDDLADRLDLFDRVRAGGPRQNCSSPRNVISRSDCVSM